MAVKLVALYKQPNDPKDFDEQYFKTHVPLAEKMPGLARMEVSKFSGNVMGGDVPYYMLAELTFDSMEDLNAAMSSAEGKAAAKNLMGFAAPYVTLLTSEVKQMEGAGVH